MRRVLFVVALLSGCRDDAADGIGVGADTGDTGGSDTTSDSVDSRDSSTGGADTDTTSAESGDTADSATTTEEPDGVLDTEILAPITIFAVRHCEKEDSDDDDPGLTEEGWDRAYALAERMTGEPLSAIYATEKRRTQETVQPTADDHALTVVTDIDPEVDLPAYILEHHQGQVVLHAGHSYTLPDFMEAFEVDDFDVDDYGQLWTLTIGIDGVVTISESTFGD